MGTILKKMLDQTEAGDDASQRKEFSDRQLVYSTVFVLIPVILVFYGYRNVWILTGLTAYFLIVAVSFRFTNELVLGQGRHFWISEILFYLLATVGEIKRGGGVWLKKIYAAARLFSVQLFFGNTAVFIFVNFREILDAVDGAIRGGSKITALSKLAVASYYGETHLVIYGGILLVLLLQKLPSIWHYANRNPGVLFLAFFCTTGILVGATLNDLANPMNGFALMSVLYLTSIVEIAWILKLGPKKSKSGIGVSDIGEKYASGFAQKLGIIGPEAYDSYQRWLSNIEKFSRSWNTVPYLLDAPIRSTLNDTFNTRSVAENIYRYVVGIKLEKDLGSSIIVGLDGKRGTGKTSVINMLKADYLDFTKDRLPYFEFKAWSYPTGGMTPGFLNEFSAFCHSNGLELEKDVDGYLESLSKLQNSFGALKLFLNPKRTNEELMNRISEEIRNTGKKILVIIDDVDRIVEKNDLAELLKLLRSTANFHGVIYLLNYSSEVLLSQKDEPDRAMLNDFETKFLNWKISMPEMDTGKAKKGIASPLKMFVQTEIEKRGLPIITSAIANRSKEIEEQLQALKTMAKSGKWQYQDIQKAFLDSLDSTFWLHKAYLEYSIERFFSAHAIDNPRDGKFVINTCLQLLDDWGQFEKCLHGDINYLIEKSMSLGRSVNMSKNVIIELMARHAPDRNSFSKLIRNKTKP